MSHFVEIARPPRPIKDDASFWVPGALIVQPEELFCDDILLMRHRVGPELGYFGVEKTTQVVQRSRERDQLTVLLAVRNESGRTDFESHVISDFGYILRLQPRGKIGAILLNKYKKSHTGFFLPYGFAN